MNDECIELFTAYCSKLYKIELQGCLVEITRSGIESIGRNCSSLLSLSLISTDDQNTSGDSVTSGQSWMLDNRIFPALINSMTSKLHHFSLSGFDMLTSNAVQKFLLHFQRTLHSLDFSELSLVNDTLLMAIENYCPSLFVLKLNHCRKITDEGINMLFPQRSNIEVLELCGCDQLTDVSCDTIAKSCSKLSIIKLDWCHLLTEKSLKSLSLYCKRLRYISMTNTALVALPPALCKLKCLTYLNIDSCISLKFPSKEVIENGLEAIFENLLNYDISQRVRCFVLGSSQSGKSSILLSLQSESMNVADGKTFGIPVKTWFPYKTSGNIIF